MKFGKAYQETIESSHFPKEWKETAIEYKQLKKVINKVAAELNQIGLTSDVLSQLLRSNAEAEVRDNDDPAQPFPSTLGSKIDGGTSAGDRRRSESDDKDDRVQVKVHAVEDDGIDGKTPKRSGSKVKGKGKEKRDERKDEDRAGSDIKDHGLKASTGKSVRIGKGKVRARAEYHLAGTADHPMPELRLLFSSASSHSSSGTDEEGDDRSDLIHHLVPENLPSASSSNEEKAGRFQEIDDEEIGDSRRDGGDAEEEDEVEVEDDVLLTQDPEEAGKGKEARDDDAGIIGRSRSKSSSRSSLGEADKDMIRRLYGFEGSVKPAEDEVGPEVAGRIGELVDRSKELESEEEDRAESDDGGDGAPKQAERESEIKVGSGGAKDNSEEGEDGHEADVEEGANQAIGLTRALFVRARKRRHRHRRQRREIVIPLNSDTEFFLLLAHALSSLQALQNAQKKAFTHSIQSLSKEISKVSSPSRSRSDLYAWREVFSLWVESHIFEGGTEKDRGERGVEECDRRLGWFVDQVGRRKLARNMRHKDSREALERFVALNVELVELKRFGAANEEAARKILKKHDKRTALTASEGFPLFIEAALSLSGSSSSSRDRLSPRPTAKTFTLTIPGIPSLPHLLLTTMTDTLLPIIPSIDDYSCAICGDVAFKPIKLDCGHKFCVRCLVKMQKRQQDDCPICRAKVVLRANAANLDTAMQSFLRLWFPREVKRKEKDNQVEASKEMLDEAGLDHRCVVV